MDNTNDLIVKRVKDARIERGLTQKDLADYLGRTAASISDLERGKVQVTASDLYRIAYFLNKPIEFFYGEKFFGTEIEDLIFLIRKMDPELRELQLPIIKSLLNLQMNVEHLETAESTELESDQVKNIAKDTYDHLIKYLISVRQLYDLGLDAKKKLEDVLEISNDELPSS